MMVQMLGVFAEFERATLIDRVVAGDGAQRGAGWLARRPSSFRLLIQPRDGFPGGRSKRWSALTRAASVRFEVPRRWPGVTRLGLSGLSRPGVVGAIGHDLPACFSA